VFCKDTERLAFATILCISIVAGDGCARARDRSVERLAVMPIENLSPDAGFNWRSRAAAAVVAYDLAGAKNLFARETDSTSAAQSMQASRMLEGYFVERNGRIGIHATLEDLTRNKTLASFELSGAAQAGFLPLANELAQRLSADARKFGTSNESAFQFYGEALTAPNAQSMQQDLESATGADSGFAPAYIDEVKMFAEKGDREGARRAAEDGRRARLDAIEQANLEYAAATVDGNARDQIQALESLTRATPANANIFKELGQLRYRRREFQKAALEYRAAARLDPDDPETWNELGYALASGKDLRGAWDALAQYQKLAPEDNNVLDSEGEVSYMRGDFKSAEESFARAAARNPAEWVKAAEARLMTGDLKGADALFLRRWGPTPRLKNTAANYEVAQWEFLTGRRNAGWAKMEDLAAKTSGDWQLLELSQMVVWRLEMGDRKGAQELAGRLDVQRAQSQEARGMSELARWLAQRGAADSNSKMANTYALLFGKQFQQALPLLQAMYSETNPSNDGAVRTLLGWAYVATGAPDKAANLVDSYPLPLSSGDGMFAALIFPRYLAVRSTVLEREGKKEEAAQSHQLYVKYAGATN